MLNKAVRNRILPLILFSIGFFVHLAPAMELTVTWDPAHGAHKLTWTPMTNSSGTVVYSIFRQFGYLIELDPQLYTSVRDVSGDNMLTDYSGPGTWTYLVSAEDGGGSTDRTGLVYVSFIHDYKRSDAEGNQETMGQEWHFKYQLQEDAYMNVGIYKPGTVFNTDGNGFAVKPPASSLVKTLVSYNGLSSSARSFEMIDSSWWNEEMWDCRDSSGQIIGNGIYSILFEAYDALGVKRDGSVSSIPIDILRIKSLSTEGLYADQPLAKITYEINAEANIRMLICKPGTSFTLSGTTGELGYLSNNYTYQYSTGDIIPINRTTGLPDGERILQVMSFFRKGGSITDSWNGKDAAGAVLDDGLYEVGISAVDEYGNIALGVSGYNQPIFNKIIIARGYIQDTQSSTNTVIIPTAVDVVDNGKKFEDKFKSSVKLYPQPVVNGSATIEYVLLDAADVSVKILNMLGEKVYQSEKHYSVKTPTGAPPDSVKWNLTDVAGVKVPPGVYLCELTATSQIKKTKTLKKIVVIK